MANLRNTRLLIAALFAVAVAVHVVFCLSLQHHFLNRFFYIAVNAKGQGACFFGIYQAGASLNGGESIYAYETYQAPASIAVPFYHHYRYLPFTAYVSAAAARLLGPWQAYWLWIAINEVLLIACIVLTVRLRRYYGRAALVAATFWLLFSPLYIELYLGQFCFAMTTMIFLLIYPALRERASPAPAASAAAARRDFLRWLAPLGWILSLLLKTFTAIYALAFLRMGRRRLALGGGAAVMATSLPYFLARPQDLSWFMHMNFHPLPPYTAGGYFGFSALMREIATHVMRLPAAGKIDLGLFDIAPVNLPVLIAIAAVLLVSTALTLRRGRLDPLDSIALWTLTFFMIFKDIWEYHYVMLLPLFVAYYLVTRSRFILVLFILIALPTPFALYDIPGSSDPKTYWSGALSLMHHSFKALPTLLFWLWVVRRELAGAGGLKGLLGGRRVVPAAEQ